MEEKEGMGQYIANRRKHMKLTQEELAEMVGVSKSAIAKWETNRGIPDRDNLKMLAVVINTPVDEFYRMISKSNSVNVSQDINITGDVISALESYGYKVIRPDV